MKTSSGTWVTQMLSSVTGSCMYGHETVEELGHVIVVELLAVRLERGNGSGASDSVLEALQLDDAECAHCSTSPALPARSPRGADAVRSSNASAGGAAHP